jgi:hypothetical protein
MVEDPIDHLGIIPKVFENIARTDYVVLAVQLQFRAPVSVKGPDMVECRQPLTEMRGALHFYPQVRVGHIFLPRRRTPTLRCQPVARVCAQLRPLHSRAKVFHRVWGVSLRGIHSSGTSCRHRQKLTPSRNIPFWHLAELVLSWINL